MINKEESRALEELVFDDNILLHAAFSVAESAKDADYLAEICKDIGQSVQTEDGQTALGAQEDLLYICDSLHQAGQVGYTRAALPIWVGSDLTQKHGPILHAVDGQPAALSATSGAGARRSGGCYLR